MRELLSALGLEVTEIAKRFDVSRPTAYRYMNCFNNGEYNKIPEKICNFFRFIAVKENQDKDLVQKYLQQEFPTDSESTTIESDSALQDIISKFCNEDQKSANFMSIVLPTGARKTTSVVNFIAQYIADGGQNNIFFVTTLKKNLPINEEPAEDQLRRSFEDYGIGSLYDEKVMMVDSLSKLLYYNYPKLSPPDRIQLRRTMGSQLVDELERIVSSMKDLNESQPTFKQFFKIFQDFESRFRSALSKNIYDTGAKTLEEKFALVTSDKDWNWVSKVYPTVYTHKRQVFLMSMDKFVSIHDTIIDGKYHLYNSDLLKNGFVFIDEFDATKETVLKSIIENDKQDVDYVGIFRRIFRTLEHNCDIWQAYYRMPEGSDEYQSMNKMVEEIHKSANALAEDYHLECDFKLFDPEVSSYIFRDNRIIKTGNNREFYLDYNEAERINYIRSAADSNIQIPRNKNGGKLTVSAMLGRMYNLFRHFESVMSVLANNQSQIAETNGKPITRDAAIRTVLDPYDFNDEQTKYLLNAIKFRPPRSGKESTYSPDLSFYEMGFEFFNFVDKDEHNLATKIYCTSIKRTPEKMLMLTLDRARNAKVIGISATARLRTVIGNYDFRYLKSQSDFKEYQLDQQDRILLKDMFAKTVDHYDRVNIVPKRITGQISEKELIKDKRTLSSLMGRLSEFDSTPFVKQRYLRVFEAYYEFLHHDDLRSMLCFMNLFPMDKNARNVEQFNAEFLKSTMSKMAEEYFSELKSEGKAIPDYLTRLKDEPYYIMRSDGFDKGKDELLNRLATGEKIFVMTTYATVGAGQNLQYEIPADVMPNIRYISSLANPERYHCKDFDAIYLDMPTNIRPNIEQYNKTNLLLSLFSIESLQENHEIDLKRAKKNIGISFAEYYGAADVIKDDPALTYSSYRMAYARRIIQAVGRICRTFSKNFNIYVYADDKLGKIFKGTSLKDFTDPNDPGKNLEEKMANPEFKALLKELQNSEYDMASKNNDMVDNESVKTKEYIDSAKRNSVWSEKSMRAWEFLREFVLRFPTAPADAKMTLIYNMYSKIEKGNVLRYRQEDDYSTVYLDQNGEYEVSSKDARLEDLLKIPIVKPLFGKPAHMDFNKMPTIKELDNIPYADSFLEDTAILCPVLYHNIYKGALGEKSGKAILESWGLHLSEIADPTKFERFDFVDDRGVYFDFKYWAGSGKIDNEKLIQKSFRKLASIGGKVAMIINVLKRKGINTTPKGYVLDGKKYSFEQDGITYNFDGLTIVTVPYLYDCDNEEAIENMDAHKSVQEVMAR